MYMCADMCDSSLSILSNFSCVIGYMFFYFCMQLVSKRIFQKQHEDGKLETEGEREEEAKYSHPSLKVVDITGLLMQTFYMNSPFIHTWLVFVPQSDRNYWFS